MEIDEIQALYVGFPQSSPVSCRSFPPILWNTSLFEQMYFSLLYISKNKQHQQKKKEHINQTKNKELS